MESFTKDIKLADIPGFTCRLLALLQTADETLGTSASYILLPLWAAAFPFFLEPSEAGNILESSDAALKCRRQTLSFRDHAGRDVLCVLLLEGFSRSELRAFDFAVAARIRNFAFLEQNE